MPAAAFLPRTAFFFAAVLLLATVSLRAAVPRDFAIDLKATVSDTAPHITLSWTQRVQSNITAQRIHRRLKGETTWVKLADLTNTQTSFVDTTAVVGVEYEYWMERNLTGLVPNVAAGYLSAGVRVPMIENRGTILLVVDDTMVAPLAGELAQLRQDLVGDGWNVQTITAPRNGTAASTKTLITNAYNADPAKVKMVYLLGYVPVPYSGQIAPDGHGDHIGAWPADGFYGDMNGTWTDTTVNTTAASRSQNDNIPGDGKYDQSTLPSLVELAVGRVHMRSMTRAPSSGVNETLLLRRYLRRAHEYRYRLGAYANVPRRTLIRDGFGHAFTSEPFAMTGWAKAFTAVGPTPTPLIEEAPSNQWFSASYAGGKTYLWGYGCGGGSYESASSVALTAELGRKPSRVVFTSMFGSYHGDWDSDNNLMRAVLAGNSTGDSLGLACFWAGRPNWFVHHMGMGETLGYSAQVSMNGGLTGGGNYQPGGSSYRGVHLGLMGDPALRLHMVEPPRGMSATSFGDKVLLRWNASSESNLLGYHVYRSNSPTGPFMRLTPTPQAGLTYEDTAVTAGLTYTYQVRTLKLEIVPGGSYENLSHASMATLVASGGAEGAPFGPSDLAVIVSQTSSTSIPLSWADNSSNETGFRVERRTGSSGSWGTIATIAANTTTFTDPGPTTAGNTYYYRVLTTGPGGDSTPSNEASFDAIAGYFELSTTKMKVNKSAGNAAIMVTRFGGGTGSISVNYATSNSSAIAGTHYTAANGALTWADGELGSKSISVPVTNTATPQQARQFKLAISSPTGGSSLAQATSIAVLIEDPTATLPAPWSQTMLGSVTDSSSSVLAEGVLGSAIMGGSGLAAADTSESGRFIYQSRSGDGVITAFFPAGIPNQTSSSRFAVMVRASTASNAIMAATATSAQTSYGTRLNYRTAPGGSSAILPAATNSLVGPRWLRLKRAENTFTSETSTDGTNWTELASTTLASMPSTALWGIFHSSANWASGSTFIGDFQLMTAQNVTITNLSTPYQAWCQANGLPIDGSGSGAPNATPMNDGVPNLMKFALGLPANSNRFQGRFSYGKVTVSNQEYLTITYTRPEPAPAGIAYAPEASGNLAGWSSNGIIEVSNVLNGNSRTITVRDGVPLTTGSPNRFLRLKVTEP